MAVFGADWDFSGDFLALSRSISFGPFTLDADARQLRETGRAAVHLSPKAFELLGVLVEARPRALSKGELHDRLWPSTFVSDATLSSVIAELREALGERGRQARYIRTLHGFGYAFAAEVHEAAAGPSRITSWIICSGREQPLPNGEHVIGRDPDVSLVLSSPSVSRRHARIVVAGQAATIEDLGSQERHVRARRTPSGRGVAC